MTRPKPAEDFLLFLIGSSLFVSGIVLFTNQVMVGSGFGGLGGGWRRGYGGGGYGGLWGGFGAGQGLGLLLLPLGAGVALLVANRLRKLGWFLLWASAAAITVLILQSLWFGLRPTSLWSVLMMVAMVAGGAGLMFRSLQRYSDSDEPPSTGASGAEELRELRQELERLRARLERDP
jgi:hypothetical protein